jgi:uncharacterized protein YjiS (DUF1127 family)
MQQSSCHAPHHHEAHPVLDCAVWSLQPSATWSSPIASTLRTIWEALRDGIAAHRQYEHLRSTGTPHGTAIRQALGTSQHERVVGGQSLKVITGAREMYRGHSYAQADVKTVHATHARRSIGGEQHVWDRVFKTWLERSNQRRTLAELDDRMLRDIGVTRSQVQHEIAKPFWSAGKQ